MDNTIKKTVMAECEITGEELDAWFDGEPDFDKFAFIVRAARRLAETDSDLFDRIARLGHPAAIDDAVEHLNWLFNAVIEARKKSGEIHAATKS